MKLPYRSAGTPSDCSNIFRNHITADNRKLLKRADVAIFVRVELTRIGRYVRTSVAVQGTVD